MPWWELSHPSQILQTSADGALVKFHNFIPSFFLNLGDIREKFYDKMFYVISNLSKGVLTTIFFKEKYNITYNITLIKVVNYLISHEDPCHARSNMSWQPLTQWPFGTHTEAMGDIQPCWCWDRIYAGFELGHYCGCRFPSTWLGRAISGQSVDIKVRHSFNTLRPRQHFADDTFKCIFLNENVWISIKISLKFVPKSPIDNIPALFQIMAWRRPGDKPLSEAMMVSLLTHICVARPQWVKDYPYVLGRQPPFCNMVSTSCGR